MNFIAPPELSPWISFRKVRFSSRFRQTRGRGHGSRKSLVSKVFHGERRRRRRVTPNPAGPFSLAAVIPGARGDVKSGLSGAAQGFFWGKSKNRPQ